MNVSRRCFIAGAAAFAVAPKPADRIRAVLLHWGHNMWGESLPEGVASIAGGRLCNSTVEFDEARWNAVTGYAAARGLNTVVIDLGEFPAYPSHPELALHGSRSPDWIRAEVRRLKSLGLEPIPKLNFSTAHDAWLGEYGRMVTTRRYYEVCRDLIRDAAEMFDHPRFFHIGYDEERAAHQHGFQCVRTDEVWWHDLLFFVRTVEDAGMRPWMWSDYGWEHPDFPEKCPRSVLQSNWYYDEWMEGFDLASMDAGARSRPILELYGKLDKAGFDQVPCSSNWCSSHRKAAGAGNDGCMAGLVEFCRANISPERLKGFMMATWADDFDAGNALPTHKAGIDQLAAALD